MKGDVGMMKECNVKYGVLAVVMLIGMLYAIAVIESVPVLGLLGIAILFFSCSVVLLFCLMKLGVMDFQEGSVWYTINQKINSSASYRHTLTGKLNSKMILSE